MEFGIKPPRYMLEKLKSNVNNEMRLAFISTLIVGFLTHMYLFTNNIINSDCVLTSPYQGGFMWELSLGRWAIKYFGMIGTNFTLPVVIGTISIFCLAIISVILTNLFNLKESINIIILSCILVTFPSITATFGFLFTADVYMISFLLSVLSIYMVNRINSLKGILLGAVLLALSMGAYQAYVGVAMMLSLILLILDILDIKKDKKEFIKNFINYTFVGVFGTGIYFIVLKIILKLKNTSLASYRGIDEMGKFSIGMLPKYINETYKYVYEFLFTNNLYYNSKLRIALYTLIVLSIIIMLIVIGINNKIHKNYIRFIILLGLLFCLPIVIAIMKILAPSTGISTLMIPQFSLFFVFAVILLEKIKDGICMNITKWITTIACILLTYNYYLLANTAYLNLQLQYEKGYAMAVRISDRVEMNKKYVPGMKVAIIGGLEKGSYVSQISAEKEVLKGMDCMDYDYPFYYNESRSWTKFMSNYLDTNFTEVSREEVDNLSKTKEFAQMSNYPSEDSTKVVNNIMVVKLSDLK